MLIMQSYCFGGQGKQKHIASEQFSLLMGQIILGKTEIKFSLSKAYIYSEIVFSIYLL